MSAILNPYHPKNAKADVMDITLLDGGLGQELLARSAAKPTGLWSTQFLIDQPDLVRQLHSDYFFAGADIASTNSYAVLPDRLSPFGLEHRFVELQRQACQLAVSARDEHGQGLVAGSMGPTGRSYRPDLAPPIEEAAELYAEIAAIQEPYVDIFLCETMSSVAQARGAVMGASSGRKPVWLAVSVDDEDGTKLRSGEDLTEILPLLSELLAPRGGESGAPLVGGAWCSIGRLCQRVCGNRAGLLTKGRDCQSSAIPQKPGARGLCPICIGLDQARSDNCRWLLRGRPVPH